MGNEESTMVDEATAPITLESRTLDGLAKYMKSGKVKKAVVMSGAGISTSAGIPDFRSPGTGLYANLARLNLPYAEAVFDISYFRQNPLPFYTLARELYPGKYRPTITHCFIKLLDQKGLLLKHFTQNIDCLDREAGVADDKIVEAHGSFAKQSCIECHASYPDSEMLKHVEAKSVPSCCKADCEGLVKPEIVFFGEALPAEFFANRSLPIEADLCIVMGTSLTVQPFASLPGLVSEGIPRVLINLEQVSSLGARPDDVLILGDCDAGVKKLATACGWSQELEDIWASTKIVKEQKIPPRSKDEALNDEVERLTNDIDRTLQLSKDHTESASKDELTRAVSFHLKGVPETSIGPSNRNHDARVLVQNSDHEEGGVDHVYPHIRKKPLL